MNPVSNAASPSASKYVNDGSSGAKLKSAGFAVHSTAALLVTSVTPSGIKITGVPVTSGARPCIRPLVDGLILAIDDSVVNPNASANISPLSRRFPGIKHPDRIGILFIARRPFFVFFYQ
ncbi:hypothetical protein [Budvicia aquatica]|uniref:hypothetical protein n=1 Tax=Budvicia aquatica TaxID=82979 RepID=UPI001B7FEA02|nr:hypothetical protein [Budvicia aquatica]